MLYEVITTTVPTYLVSTQLLISGGHETGPTIGNSEGALPGVNLGMTNNIENQLIILTSYGQIEKTLNQLEFDVSYYSKGLFIDNEIYDKSPFKVITDGKTDHLDETRFCIEFISDKEFYLTRSDVEDFIEEYKFFEKIVLSDISFSIIPVPTNIEDGNYLEKQYCFQFNSRSSMIRHYQRELTVEPVQKDATIYQISLVETNYRKGIDFLNQLAKNSVNYTLDKKNQIAINTIDFIERQLVGVSDSLSVAKNVLENFRSRNEMMNVSMQEQVIIEQSQELENQKDILLKQLDYYNYLNDYVVVDQDVIHLVPPSARGVNDPVITQMITELSSLSAERSSLQFNSKIENPSISRINRSIESLKKSVLQQAKNNIVSTQNSIAAVNRKLMNLSSQIRRLPKTEQKLIDIERKFHSTDKMYTYLMERRSNAQLAKASNVPDNEIIEEATFRSQMAPDMVRFVMIVVIFGLFFPSVVVFLIVYQNNRIQDIDDLEVLGIPVLGAITAKDKHTTHESIVNNPRSLLSESIRNIRTSIDFKSNGSKDNTLLVTSGLPGEGKSFCALGLAISYAQLGKKTILLDFDMRKPTIGELLNIHHEGKGLSHFLLENIDENRSHLIEMSSIPNLSVILSGDIPPNPVELIAGSQTDYLFEELKKLYDVVVIDSPPIGLVTDAHLLTKYSDVNILVTRHDSTPKPMLRHLLKDPRIKDNGHFCLLLNDFPFTRKGYGYGYNSDYYKN